MTLKPPKFCAITGETFALDEADRELLLKVSPTINGRLYTLPDPTCSPRARLMRRLAYRNQIHVFNRRSSSTGKTIFAMYPDGTSFPVIDKDEWYDDGWDPLQYGRDFDFSRPFFEQFHALEQCVPHPSLATINILDNSEYINNASSLRNCYFVFNNDYLQDCMYCETCDYSNDCIDCSRAPHCELCYDCTECSRCYNLQSSTCCDECRDSFFLLNCRGCTDCFGCVNLRRSRYCIFNQQVSAKQFADFLAGLDLSSYSARLEWAAKADAFHRTQPRPHMVGTFTESVSGNCLFECKNVHKSFAVRGGEDLRHCYFLTSGAKDSMDLAVWCAEFELGYECLCCGYGAQRLRFCNDCWGGVTDLNYCVFCSSSSNLFGCFGLRKKEFCILNKQYRKDDYFSLVQRIIAHMMGTGEWGEFFPASQSPIPYNCSLANRYFPLRESEARERRFNWLTKPQAAVIGAVKAEDLPDALPPTDTSFDVIGLGDTRPFRVTSREIQIFRRLRAPLPRIAYDLRMDARQRRLGGIFLRSSTCAKSGEALLCTVSGEDGWIVWSKDLYDQEFGS